MLIFPWMCCPYWLQNKTLLTKAKTRGYATSQFSEMPLTFSYSFTPNSVKFSTLCVLLNAELAALFCANSVFFFAKDDPNKSICTPTKLTHKALIEPKPMWHEILSNNLDFGKTLTLSCYFASNVMAPFLDMDQCPDVKLTFCSDLVSIIYCMWHQDLHNKTKGTAQTWYFCTLIS